VFADDVFHGGVTPDVAVQRLARELLYVLNVDHQPLVRRPTSIASLRSITDYVKQSAVKSRAVELMRVTILKN